MLTVTPTDMTGQTTSPVQGQIPQKEVPAPTPEVAQEKPKANPMAPQFAALAKKERMIREQARQIQAEKQAMESRLNETKTQLQSEWKQRLLQNPWDVMIEAGLSPDQATQLILNQPKPEEVELQKLKKEIENIRSSQDQTKDLMKQQQDEQYKQAKKQISLEVKSLVSSDSSFETIQAMSAEAAVTELIEQTFLKDGYLMPVEAAAKEVEDYLVEQALGLAKLKKIQDKMIPQAPENSFTQAVKQNQIQKPQSNTLSNRMVSSSTKPLSDKDRRQRAILAFEGKL